MISLLVWVREDGLPQLAHAFMSAVLYQWSGVRVHVNHDVAPIPRFGVPIRP